MLLDQTLEINYNRAALTHPNVGIRTITRFHRDYIVTLAEHYAHLSVIICSMHRRSLAKQKRRVKYE